MDRLIIRDTSPSDKLDIGGHIILYTDSYITNYALYILDNDPINNLETNKIMTAVEFYAEQMQLKEQFTQEEFNNITNQAKEMEKQQQGYSEEDMLKMLQKFGFDYIYNYKGEKSIYEWIPEWFEEYKRLEQFKNK